MTQLTWGAPGERTYEVGVDRGVLFVDDAAGVAWNGLVSVSESPSGGEPKAYYLDGVKYLNVAADEEFEATLEAFTYPDEFEQCDGTLLLSNGLFISQQDRKTFGLVYRTKIGNDLDGSDHAYKIHILYNVLASPTARSNRTMGGSVDPLNFSWKLTTKPSSIVGYKPASHFTIDSRETPEFVLQQIENMLYGDAVTDPHLPSVLELIFIFTSYDSDVHDAGGPTEPYFATLDAGSPSTVATTTIDGGTP